MSRNLLALALVGLLLAAAAPRANAGIFDSIGDALSSAGQAVVGAGEKAVEGVKDAAGAVKDTAVSGWDTVSGWSEEAWNKVKDTFVNAKDYVECKALDWTVVNLDQCWRAPPSDLCPAVCKENIDKLPDACLERILSGVQDEGNPAAIDRLQKQLTACGRTITVGTGAVLAEEAFGIASTDSACDGVDWSVVNTTSCYDALDVSDVACPGECSALLEAVPAPCLASLAANATAVAEAEQEVQFFLALCNEGNTTAPAA